MIQVSEKFEKELYKFNEWLECSGYRIRTEDGSEETWGLQLLNDFKEQGRNKLDHYLKELMKTYTISRADENVEDYKLVVKEFKECKPKGTRKAKIQKEEKPSNREIRAVSYNSADISKLCDEVAEMRKRINEMEKRLDRAEKGEKKTIENPIKKRETDCCKGEIASSEMTDFGEDIDLGDISDIDFDD